MYRSRHTASRTQQRPDLGRTQSYGGVNNDTHNIYRDPPVLNNKKSKGIAGFFGLGKKHKREGSNARATVSSPSAMGQHHHSQYSASAEHLHMTTPKASPQLQLSFNQYDGMRLALPSFKSDGKPYKTSPNESMRFALPSPTSDAMRHVMPSPTSDAMRYNMSPSSVTSSQYTESDFYFSDKHKESSSGHFSPGPPRTAPTPTRSSFFTNDESKRRPRLDAPFTTSLPAFSSETVKSPRHLRNNSVTATNWLQQPPARRPSFNHAGTAPQSPILPKERPHSPSRSPDKLEIESNSSRYAHHRVLTAPSVDMRFSSTRSAPATYHSNAEKEAAFENLLASGKTKRLQATAPFAQH